MNRTQQANTAHNHKAMYEAFLELLYTFPHSDIENGISKLFHDLEKENKVSLSKNGRDQIKALKTFAKAATAIVVSEDQNLNEINKSGVLFTPEEELVNEVKEVFSYAEAGHFREQLYFATQAYAEDNGPENLKLTQDAICDFEVLNKFLYNAERIIQKNTL